MGPRMRPFRRRSTVSDPSGPVAAGAASSEVEPALAEAGDAVAR